LGAVIEHLRAKLMKLCLHWSPTNGPDEEYLGPLTPDSSALVAIICLQERYRASRYIGPGDHWGPDTWHDTAEEARAAAEAWMLTQLSATQRLAVYAARAAFHSDPKETT
jgi:tagatose-1,6-bisphosphate aldolase non-catalytic subunit AgaZ/GatZ